MEWAFIFVVCIAAAFAYGKFSQRTEKESEVEFIEHVRRGMEEGLKDDFLPEKAEELRASEYFKYEHIRDFRNAYVVGSVAKELDLAPRVAAESILLGRFLGRSDGESIQLLKERVREFRARASSTKRL